MVPVFALSLFASAFLLFLIQPLFARMALPLLGGSPNVWIICMLFFQTMLLAGYIYAHLICRWLGFKKQLALHALVVLLPLMVLPIAISESVTPPSEGNPVPWLLYLLVITLGLPFLAVSSSAPLLQRWFSYASHSSSDDPYFLYAASNVGSILALAAYPTLFEPLLRLSWQSLGWSGGYLLFIVLTAACGFLVWRSSGDSGGRLNEPVTPKTTVSAVNPIQDSISWQRRFWWIIFSFVPSSLTLGVTTIITTDIAAVPMFWVVPLILYLLSYVLVFAPKRIYSPAMVARAFPFCMIAAVALLLTGAAQPVLLIVIIHLVTLFVTAMLCHGALADDRPSAGQLTEFYLYLGIGGMLGGVFNALIAPYVFTDIVEYPLIIVVACLIAARIEAASAEKPIVSSRTFRFTDLLYPALLGLLTVGLILIANELSGAQRAFRVVLIAGLPIMAVFLLSKRRLRFALGIAALTIAANFNDFDQGRALEARRTFFGVHRITRFNIDDAEAGNRFAVNLLYNGTTMHGSQLIEPTHNTPAFSHIPLVYYHRDGPVGDLMFSLQQTGEASNVGLVGLGAGAIAAYGNAGEHYTFFEIDPEVAAIAEDERYFSYLNDARKRGVSVNVVLGDARLKLKHFPNGSLDVLVLDAFSSDAIPVHLLSKQALALYMTKLNANGVLAFHLSNRHLNLRDTVARIADELELVALWRLDVNRSSKHYERVLRRNSEWLLMATTRASLQRVTDARPMAGWRYIEAAKGTPVWTDDFSNILSVFRW